VLEFCPRVTLGAGQMKMRSAAREIFMARYKLIVLTNPHPGQDQEYNDWYTQQHLQDVTAVPGYLSAQRFKLRHPMGFEHEWRYLAIYEVETNDPEASVTALLSRQGTDAMLISEALDLDGAVAGLFEPISPVVTAAKDAAAAFT
jgi:hypothetical protein